MLTGPQIAEYVASGELVISPFNPARLGPNSYDVTLGPKLCRYGALLLDAKREQELVEIPFDDRGLVLRPGVLYLGHTVEVVGCRASLPGKPPGEGLGFVPCLEGKSSVGRLGVSVHATAGFGDDGFVSDWTLELSVVQPVVVYPGMLIGQVYFVRVDDSTKRDPYHGHYATQRGPTASMLWKTFK